MTDEHVFQNPLDWGDGPWCNEPGMQALIKGIYRQHNYELYRNFTGSWCGYVAVDLNSPYAQEDYSAIQLDVHGGVTFGRILMDQDTSTERYYIGFDCSHFNDYCPRMQRINEYRDEDVPADASDEFVSTWATLKKLAEKSSAIKPFFDKTSYKTLEFATNQCKSMIDQIIANPEMK